MPHRLERPGNRQIPLKHEILNFGLRYQLRADSFSRGAFLPAAAAFTFYGEISGRSLSGKSIGKKQQTGGEQNHGQMSPRKSPGWECAEKIANNVEFYNNYAPKCQNFIKNNLTAAMTGSL